VTSSSLSAPSSQVLSLADLTPALLARLKKKDVLGGTSVYDPEQNPWQVCELIKSFQNLPLRRHEICLLFPTWYLFYGLFASTALPFKFFKN
jgi:hypothetical protein